MEFSSILIIAATLWLMAGLLFYAYYKREETQKFCDVMWNFALYAGPYWIVIGIIIIYMLFDA